MTISLRKSVALALIAALLALSPNLPAYQAFAATVARPVPAGMSMPVTPAFNAGASAGGGLLQRDRSLSDSAFPLRGRLPVSAIPTPAVSAAPQTAEPVRAAVPAVLKSLAPQAAAPAEAGAAALQAAFDAPLAQALDGVADPEALAAAVQTGVSRGEVGDVQALGRVFDNAQRGRGDAFKVAQDHPLAPADAVSGPAQEEKAMQASWKLQSSKPLVSDWREKILSRPQYQGFDVKIKFEEGIALENLLWAIGVDGIVTQPDGDRVTATLPNASLKRAAEVARIMADYDVVAEVSVSRPVAWRLDEVRRLPKSSDTRFEDPKLVGPAVAKIRELFSGVKTRGDGEYESKQGRREQLASVGVSLRRAKADRVTLDISHSRRGSAGGTESLSVTLIDGDRPEILVQSKPGAGIFPRPGSTVEWARISMDKTSVILILETEDGNIASYEIKLQPDGSVKFSESGYTGTIRTTLPRRY